MKKVYYICHCGTGQTLFEDLIELVKEEGNKLLFHFNNAYDFDFHKTRTITLKAFRKAKRNSYGELMNYIDFNSSKEQFKYSFIREYEINDNETPEKRRIIK